jgi:hypothetical protein
MSSLVYLITKERHLEGVDRRLESFDFHLKMEPYEVPCECLGRKAEIEAEASPEVRALDLNLKVLRERGGWESRRLIELSGERLPFSYSLLSDPQAQGTVIHLAPGSDQRRMLSLLDEWRSIKSKRQVLIRSRAAAHPLWRKPDPQCRECLGRGHQQTTTNPQGLWHSWEMVTERPVFSEAGVDKSLPYLIRKSDLVEQLASKKAALPDAVITSGGDLFRLKSLDYGCHPSLASSQWHQQALELVEGDHGEYVWAIDCYM